MMRFKWIPTSTFFTFSYFAFSSILFSTPLFSTPSFAQNYCLAIRGNGELMPAHWGAMAQTVENFGMPWAVAGGSSASISAFLIESLALNPLVKNSQDVNEQALQASFLLKSMPGFMQAIAPTPEWKILLEAVKSLSPSHLQETRTNIHNIFERLQHQVHFLTPEDVQSISLALNDIHHTQIFTGPALIKLQEALKNYQSNPTPQTLLNLKKQVGQVHQAFTVFGKFDARNDSALFVRDGLVNFGKLGAAFGKMAAFYAMKKASPQTLSLMKKFITQYAASSIGHSWTEITTQNPQIQDQLRSLIESYFAHYKDSQNRIKDPMSVGLHTLITTSVLLGNSRSTYLEQKRKYEQTLNPSDADPLNISPSDLRFGYWGTSSDLQKIAQHFTESNEQASLEKSKKFYALGQATWEVALVTSPAEPGLSALVPFQVENGTQWIFSLGGWSDLHPIPVLKAMGCQNVIYITRKGGDSLFSQGVAKRLFKINDKELPWSRLDSSKESLILNNRGLSEDQSSSWSLMYNLANPQSSFAGSLRQADAVVCTDWNSFEIKKDFHAMINEAYHAPVYIPIWPTPLYMTHYWSQPHFISEKDNLLDENGVPLYSGCIP